MSANSMKRPFSLGPWLLHRLPRNPVVARIARAYLNHYRSENNVWADSNGEFRLLEQVMPHCAVVLDVGANIGDWTRQALAVNPSLRVHCFEPAPDNYDKLDAQGFNDSVTLNNMAVSAVDGPVTLNLYGENSPLNSLVVSQSTPHGVQTGSIKLTSTTVDSYMAAHGIVHIDFMKIDVEGAELDVLRGAEAALKQHAIDAVQFEYGQCNVQARSLLRDFFQLLTSHDFVMYKISATCLLRYDVYSEALENFQHQNWLAVRTGTLLQSRVECESTQGGFI